MTVVGEERGRVLLITGAELKAFIKAVNRITKEKENELTEKLYRRLK